MEEHNNDVEFTSQGSSGLVVDHELESQRTRALTSHETTDLDEHHSELNNPIHKGEEQQLIW